VCKLKLEKDPKEDAEAAAEEAAISTPHCVWQIHTLPRTLCAAGFFVCKLKKVSNAKLEKDPKEDAEADAEEAAAARAADGARGDAASAAGPAAKKLKRKAAAAEDTGAAYEIAMRRA